MKEPKNSSKRQAKTERTLIHGLTYDRKTSRWSCKCGYVLGDGHHALYAVCPLSHRDKKVNAQVSLSSNEDKLPRRSKVVGVVCGSFGCKKITEDDLQPPLKQAALDLFQI